MDLIYTVFDDNIHPLFMAHLYGEFLEDDLLEVADELPDGRLSHIVLKGTMIPVGYLGDDSLEIVRDKNIKKDSPEIIKGKKRISEIYNRCWFKTLTQIFYSPN